MNKTKQKKAGRVRAPARNSRNKQGMLLDVSHPAEKKLSATAQRYRELCDARMAALAPELEMRDQLLELMRASKLTEFRANGLIVTVVKSQDKVKVRVNGSDDDVSQD